jgi:hypothetical protein
VQHSQNAPGIDVGLLDDRAALLRIGSHADIPARPVHTEFKHGRIRSRRCPLDLAVDAQAQHESTRPVNIGIGRRNLHFALELRDFTVGPEFGKLP